MKQKKITRKDKMKCVQDKVCWKCGNKIIIEKKKIKCCNCSLEFIMYN